jgi:glyoxylase I family protein
MIQLDHLILHVREPAEMVQFYGEVLGFTHAGRAEPFEVLRVNEQLTIDLMQAPPGHPQHLAFALEREDFDAVHQRLIRMGIPYGGTPFDRSSKGPAQTQGARGMAESIYFYDPDRNNIEIRCYSS